MSIDSAITHFMLATAIILGLSYLTGQLFRRLGQPTVVGQILAGIALGPSVLGRFSEKTAYALFPAATVTYLQVTSQVALVLVLFGIGYELDLRLLPRLRRTVAALSVGTFVVPMMLGVTSVYAFRHWYRAVGELRAGTGSFTLFMGVAVSVTAVPVLASIVRERGIAATLPGVAAMTSAGLIDALGWLALAGVLVMAGVSAGTHRPWAMTVLLLAGYSAAMAFLVRPVLRRWLQRPNAVLTGKVPVAVALAMASAWVTAALGLQVVFGAFLAGLLMPRETGGASDADVLQPVHDVGWLLVPVFFIISGQGVNIGAMHVHDFAMLGMLCAIAVTGKLGAGFLAGRVAGLSRHDSAVTGVLLNTRGLTELIALNVGLHAGLIHQELYTILVLMALVTTLTTGPLLALFRSPERVSLAAPEPNLTPAGPTPSYRPLSRRAASMSAPARSAPPAP